MMQGERVVLKKTCDSCAASKIKCVGGCPCQRCVRKGICCAFSPRKRRAASVLSVTPAPPIKMSTMGNLDPWEKTCIKTFFALFQSYFHHKPSQRSQLWFCLHANKLNTQQVTVGQAEMVRTLKQWLGSMNLGTSSVAKKFEASVTYHRELSRISMAKKGLRPQTQILNWSSIKIDESQPFLKLAFEFNNSEQDRIGYVDHMEICVNQSFTEHFGLTEADFMMQFRQSQGGYLPWGADVLSRVLANEEDLTAFVHIIAIKFNAMKPLDSVPCERFLPSAHIFPVRLASGEVVKAHLKCLHKAIFQGFGPGQLNLRHEYSFMFTGLSYVAEKVQLIEDDWNPVRQMKRELYPEKLPEDFNLAPSEEWEAIFD